MGEAPAQSLRPLALVESGQRPTHRLRLADESTPTGRARPRGVLGTEVWMKRVEPGARHQTPGAGDGTGTGATAGQVPSAQSQAPSAQSPVPGFSFLTMTTKPSFRAEFKAGEGGTTPVYLARWVSTRGEKGPWSEVTSATVAAWRATEAA